MVKTKGMFFVTWDKMCRPKKLGSLRFKNFHISSIKPSDSLLAQVLKAKYRIFLIFLEAKMGNSRSYIWRSILFGDGTGVRIFQHPWIANSVSSEQLIVLALIDNGRWKEDLVNMLFCRRDREAIYKIPLNPSGGEDVLVWNLLCGVVIQEELSSVALNSNGHRFGILKYHQK